MQLRLVGDLTDQLGAAGAAHRRHPPEGCREAVAETPPNSDPDAARRAHAQDDQAELRERASPSADFTQDDCALHSVDGRR
jgi:hypothetical protein